MPGMEMGSGAAPWPALAEIALFWSAAVVHVLRLLSRPWLPDADPLGDAGHAVMAAGMVFMVFPGAPAGSGPVLSASFTALAALFAGSALRGGAGGRRLQHTAIGCGQAATAVMLAAHGRLGPAVTVPMAGVLLVCAAVHARRWSDAHTAHGIRAGSGPVSAPAGGARVLVTLPHLGALATTLAMAAMAAAA